MHELRDRADVTSRRDTAEPIAIVGLACHFPGADGPEAFWELLYEGRDAIQPMPLDRPQLIDSYDANPDVPGKTATRWGGFVSGVEDFDAAFFNISPREAARIDPQQRLVLQVAWQALENGAIAPGDLRGKRVGVFIGASSYDFGRLLARDPSLITGSAGAGAALSIIANRLSYALDLRGPSLTVDTACSSSLVAVHMACQALTAGDCELALAGGVNLLAAAEPFIAFSKARMMAPDGRCKAFDDRADGYVRGEGCGIVVLRLDSAARAAGDAPIALILGTAINHDGLTNGLTAPNPRAQTSVIQEACRRARVSPSAIQYVEAHGTGTALGDPIEVSALAAALGPGRTKAKPVLLGSVKSNIGHLEAAAGIAGMIKCALALRHGYIPKSLHIANPNHLIPFDDLPVVLARQGQPWPERNGPRLAGVSSFGFGGTNGHAILQAPTGEDRRPERFRFRSHHLLCLSAKDEESLSVLARRYSAFLERAADVPTGDICRTANAGRSHFRHRLAVVGKSVGDLRQRLDEFLDNGGALKALTGTDGRRAPKVAFLFSGQGAQFPGMCRQLYDESPVFSREIDRAAAFLEDKSPGFDLKTQLFVLNPKSKLDQTTYTQPALFAVEAALSALWRSWGIEPVALCGHSLGEYAAAYVAGIYSFEDALNLVYERGRLMQSLPGNGTMVAVQLTEADLQSRICRAEARTSVSVAAINGPRSCTIAGDAQVIGRFTERLGKEGVRCVALNTSHAFHSPLIEPMLDNLEAIVQKADAKPATLPLVLNATGALLPEGKTLPPVYWRAQSLGTVRFADCLENLVETGATVLLEIGPDAVLAAMAHQTIRRRDVTILPSLRRGRDDWQILLTALGTLYVRGSPVEWHSVDGSYGERRPFLPNYPFRNQRHWLWSEPEGAEEEISMARPQHDSPQRTANRRTTIEEQVRRLLAQVLEMDASEIDSRTLFSELCADSVLLMELVARLESAFRVELSGRQLYEEVATLADLVAFLDANQPPDPLASDAAISPDGGGGTEAPGTPAGSSVLPTFEPLNATGDASEIVRQQLDMVYRIIDRQLAAFGTQDKGSQPRRAASHSGPPRDPAATPAEGRPEPRHVESASVPEPLDPAWRAEAMRLIDAGNTKRVRSKALTANHRAVLADPRAVAGFRPPMKELLYPIAGAKAHGARLWDVDGNEYIDLTMGFGALLFGHDPAFLREAVERQLASGLLLGPQASQAGEVAAMIAEFTGLPRVTFCATGTEAVMLALRLARRATGRNGIVQFAGAYHGHFDGTLAMPSSDHTGRPLAPGVAPGAVSDTRVLRYGDSAALAQIRERAGEIAAVLVEPVQSRHPELQPHEFLKELRALTRQLDIALVFDEVITGFRTAPGGAQAWFDVMADIAVYGKSLGGGLPIGVVAGGGRYLDGVDGGDWRYGDDSAPNPSRTFFAGTYNKHPLSMAAAHAVLTELKRRGADFQTELNARTAELSDRLNGLFEARNAPLRVNHFASFFRFAHTQNLDLFYHELLDRGLYIWEGRTCFLSAAHDRDEMEEIVTRVGQAVTALFGEPTVASAGPDQVASSTAAAARGRSKMPALPEIANGSLFARVTRDPREIDAALALRYDVFMREMGAQAAPGHPGVDRDAFDAHCDHLVVWDKATNRLVGTYRLIDHDAAERVGGFYSAQEFDLAPLLRRPGKLLELGRSCIAPEYRNGDTMYLLWSGIAAYVRAKEILTVFGCASLHGVKPEAHAEALAYLHRYHLAPPELRVTALPQRRADLDLDSVTLPNRRTVRASLPPLFKGYLRMGAVVGDGVVIDETFNTVDVAMILDSVAFREHERDLLRFGTMESA